MINAAIIGLGGWGRRLVESVQGKSEKIRFMSAVVRNPGKVEDFAAAQGLALGSDLDAVLGDPAIDAVVVASAGGVHAPHGLAAIRAGKPVMVIKPLALNLADAEMLRDEAERAGVLLALGYDRCFLPANGELRRRVAAGDLGTVLHTEGNFCVDRYLHLSADSWKTDGRQITPGSLTDHMLYEMIRMFGPVAEVHAYGTDHLGIGTLKDTTAVLLRFQNGVTGLLTAIGATAELYRLQVYGTKGWIEVRGTRQFTFKPTKGDMEETTFPQLDPRLQELESFADAVTGAGDFPVSVEEACWAVAAIEGMARSVSEGKPVSVV